MSKRETQLAVETTCGKEHVAKVLRETIEEYMDEIIDQGAADITTYLQHTYWPSKDERLAILSSTDFSPRDAVITILSTVLPVTVPQQIQNVAARLASTLDMEKIDAIKTASEIIGVVSHTGAYEFISPRDSETSSMLVRSCFEPSEEMASLVNSSMYLPPMIVPPRKIKTNSDCGYLTGNTGVILGKGNHHDYELPLDVINRDNAIKLSIDERMLNMVEEPKKAFDSGSKYEATPHHLKHLYVARKRQSFETLVEVSNEVYQYILDNNNLFYLTHRVDERIRYYDQSYFIGHQASQYKKALIDFHDKEIINC